MPRPPLETAQANSRRECRHFEHHLERNARIAAHSFERFLAKRMGAAGRARVVASFDYDALASRLADTLEEVAG